MIFYELLRNQWLLLFIRKKYRFYNEERKVQIVDTVRI